MQKMLRVYLDHLIPHSQSQILDNASTSKLVRTSYSTAMQVASVQYLVNPNKHWQKLPHYRKTCVWTPEDCFEWLDSAFNISALSGITIWENQEEEYPNNAYIIDGCHRLSTLIAFARNDWGDQPSLSTSDDPIKAKNYRSAAQVTRKLLKSHFGDLQEKDWIRFWDINLPLTRILGGPEQIKEIYAALHKKDIPIDSTRKTIFISYRRDDSQGICGRIYDHLEQHFGRDYVFKDVDSILFGDDFEATINETLQECAVVLVVIGKNWLDITDAQGNRRLTDPRDFVRREIELALQRQIPIIPLFVDGASLSSPNQLPTKIRQLMKFQSTVIHHDPDFKRDMRRLIEHLEHIPSLATSNKNVN